MPKIKGSLDLWFCSLDSDLFWTGIHWASLYNILSVDYLNILVAAQFNTIYRRSLIFFWSCPFKKDLYCYSTLWFSANDIVICCENPQANWVLIERYHLLWFIYWLVSCLQLWAFTCFFNLKIEWPLCVSVVMASSSALWNFIWLLSKLDRVLIFYRVDLRSASFMLFSTAEHRAVSWRSKLWWNESQENIFMIRGTSKVQGFFVILANRMEKQNRVLRFWWSKR